MPNIRAANIVVLSVPLDNQTAAWVKRFARKQGFVRRYGGTEEKPNTAEAVRFMIESVKKASNGR